MPSMREKKRICAEGIIQKRQSTSFIWMDGKNNISSFVYLNQQKNFNRYYFNSYSLTPRWENSLISVELTLN
jgi:hypothetical protein